jgi:hypothetical protein
VVLIVAGAALGVEAGNTEDRVAAASMGGGAWNAELARLYDDGRTQANAATALLAVGGVAAGVGAIVAIVGGVHRAKHKRALAPALKGTGVAWSIAF